MSSPLQPDSPLHSTTLVSIIVDVLVSHLLANAFRPACLCTLSPSLIRVARSMKCESRVPFGFRADIEDGGPSTHPPICILPLPREHQITPQDPFISCFDLLPFMQQAISPMLV